jgi:hypothetical protein
MSKNRPYGGVSKRSRRANVDYGVNNQLMGKMNARELHGMNIYRWEDDDLCMFQTYNLCNILTTYPPYFVAFKHFDRLRPKPDCLTTE